MASIGPLRAPSQNRVPELRGWSTMIRMFSCAQFDWCMELTQPKASQSTSLAHSMARARLGGRKVCYALTSPAVAYELSRREMRELTCGDCIELCSDHKEQMILMSTNYR